MEQNGYVLNSILVPWLMAAQSLVTNGIARPEDIDRTWMITTKMPVGPVGILDMVGLETFHSIASYWGEVSNDEQLKKNAAYLKTHFVDTEQARREDRRRLLQASQSGLSGAGFPVPEESDDMNIKKVLVVGSGTLGQQIGFQCAMHGFDVVMYDVKQETLDACRAIQREYGELFRSRGRSKAEVDAALARISYTLDLEEAGRDADLVSESVPENPDIKRKVYPLLHAACPPKTIFTTNTSTLLPSQIADATGRPERFLALHFANEIWDRNIGEVMGHAGTDREIFEIVVKFAKAIGMVPIRVEKEQNGYIINSLLVPWLMAAQSARHQWRRTAGRRRSHLDDHDENVRRTFRVPGHDRPRDRLQRRFLLGRGPRGRATEEECGLPQDALRRQEQAGRENRRGLLHSIRIRPISSRAFLS